MKRTGVGWRYTSRWYGTRRTIARSISSPGHGRRCACRAWHGMSGSRPIAPRCAGWQLAWLVDQMDAESSIGMIGFSFGARVITGALHVLGGGQLDRMSWPVRPPADRGKIRTVLMTAALDDDWLLPGHYHGLAPSQVERMLLLNNSCDRAMKWYHMINRCRHPTALGRWGIPSSWLLGADARKIDQCDVCSQLGQIHSFQSYLGCPDLMRQTWWHLSFEPHFAEHVHGGTDRSVE